MWVGMFTPTNVISLQIDHFAEVLYFIENIHREAKAAFGYMYAFSRER